MVPAGTMAIHSKMVSKILSDKIHGVNVSILVFTDSFCLIPAFYSMLVIGNSQKLAISVLNWEHLLTY